MVTQYDAVAEIEAMKWRRPRQSPQSPEAGRLPAPDRRDWDGATEAAIRAEMERRFARRGLVEYAG